MSPMENAASVPAGGQTPPAVSEVGSPTPIAGNWTQSLFDKSDNPAAPPPMPQLVERQESQEQQQPVEETPAEQPVEAQSEAPANPDEVTVSAEDQPLYDSILEEIKAQHPGADPKLLKRLADGNFMIKKFMAADQDKSKQITKLLKRVTKKVDGVRAITDFERSLTAPPAAMEAPVAPAQVAPAQTQQPQQPQQQQNELPAYLRWNSPLDAVGAETQAWADYTNAEATPQQQAEAAQRLFTIREAQAFMTTQQVLANLDINSLVEKKARELIQSELGDVLPAVRQTAQEHAAEAAHQFAIAELTKAGVEGVSDLVKPISDEPLIVNGQEYDQTPYNLAVQRVPSIATIRITHDQQGKPYARDVAERLTRIERYRAAAEVWSMMNQPAKAGTSGTPDPSAVAQQAFQAGVQSRDRAEADRARQGLNAGSGATTLGGKPAERSLVDDFRESGAINYSGLWKRS
jgi:hypothetical protein